MVKMVGHHHVDFMLSTFYGNNDKLSLNYYNFTLQPIPNRRVVLHGSKHHIFSKQHPQGKIAHLAYNKGLRLLKESGTLTRALRESGIINQQTANWPIINLP